MKGDRNQDEVSMTKERTNALFISCALVVLVGPVKLCALYTSKVGETGLEPVTSVSKIHHRRDQK